MSTRLTLKYLFLSLRPAQWAKNLFVLLPLVFSQKLFIFPDNVRTFVAAALFCLLAGACYLLNDWMDRDRDLRHPTKRLRPVAQGTVHPRLALIGFVGLAAISLWLAFCLSPSLGRVFLLYLTLNVLYSRYLKGVVIVDVFCLGAFFVIRILAGGAVTQVEISHWMLIMTLLLAMFLGFNKRRQEFIHSGETPSEKRSVLSQYNVYFIDQMISVLTASIVIVYLLYTVDDRTVRIFGSNHLYYSTPFVYYGIFRYLYVVHAQEGGEDPTVVFLNDRMMQINLLLWILTCIGVIYFKI